MIGHHGVEALAFLALLGRQGGGGGGGDLPPIPPMPGPVPPIPGGGDGPSPVIAPAWPSTVPPDLPPFPGDGWEADTPVSQAVIQRAWALLPTLWAQGEGAHTVEMTAGHWVTYKAQWMEGGKKGVTAWRVKASAMPQGQLSPSPSADVARRTTVPPIVPAAPSQQQGAGRPVTPASGDIPIIPVSAPQGEPLTPSGAMTPAQQAAHNMNSALIAHGYKRVDMPIYGAFQRSVGLEADGYPGAGTMTALSRALVTMGERMASVQRYPWHAKPGTSGYDGVNAPTWAEWTSA